MFAAGRWPSAARVGIERAIGRHQLPWVVYFAHAPVCGLIPILKWPFADADAALVFAVLSLAANLFAAALTALFGEELMAGFFALAALLSGVAIALGYDDVMPLSC